MSITLSTLAQGVDERFEITDDEEAKRFLLELGVMDRFKRIAVPGKANVQSVVYGEHPTHHVVSLLYAGNPREAENGYLIYCFPKSKMPHPEFMEVVSKLLRSGTVTNVTSFESGSPQN